MVDISAKLAASKRMHARAWLEWARGWERSLKRQPIEARLETLRPIYADLPPRVADRTMRGLRRADAHKLKKSESTFSTGTGRAFDTQSRTRQPTVTRSDQPGAHRSGADIPEPDHSLGGFDRRFAPNESTAADKAIAAVLLASVAALLAYNLPTRVFIPGNATFFLVIGLIGVWRYSWWLVQAVRASVYKRYVFPRHRALANRYVDDRPSHVFALVTSYEVDPQVTWITYHSLLSELVTYGAPATVVAQVSHESDANLIASIAKGLDLPARVEVVTMYQDGTGKRPAMAQALRAISRRMPQEDSVCIFMDGDCKLTEGTLTGTLPFFKCMPDVGGVTVDNRAVVEGGAWTREWYNLKLAQRDLYMSSLALSRQLLVLTGRFSVIRATQAADPDFIQLVESDYIEHWRLGRINFLSGDDKSTWFWLLKHGWRMVYVPDVRSDSFEELPSPWLIKGGWQLMIRWFGNMLRTNGRAIRLGPRRMKPFIWWALVDQRFTVFTGFIGPVAAVALSLEYGWRVLVAYGLWVVLTRTIMSMLIGLQRASYSAHWPFLLVFNQLVGTAAKQYVAFRLNRQSWARQNIRSGQAATRFRRFVQGTVDNIIHGSAVVAFVLAIFFYTGFYTFPERQAVLGMLGWSDSGDGSQAEQLNYAVDRLPAGHRLDLPPGDYRLSSQIASDRANRQIVGAHDGKVTVYLGQPGTRSADMHTVDCRISPLPPAYRIGGPNPVTLRNVVVRVPARHLVARQTPNADRAVETSAGLSK